MRVGQNPNRLAKVEGYAPVVLGVITHLPMTKGYHQHRLEVIQCSLETMRQRATGDFEIVVWDNGSCDTLLDWLREDYRPDYLITTRNVGKSIARASIVRMLPPDTIVGIADDDIFYYPGWLGKQLKVLRYYPHVGTVSGWPVRTQFRFHNEATVRWAKENQKVKMQVGRFISKEEDRDFCDSIGRDYTFQVPYTQHDRDIKLTYRGIETYATGHHAQWIGKAGVVAPYLTYTEEAMADERPFEDAIDNAGLLRLTTFERCTQHIGNQLDPRLEELWRECVI